VAVLCPRGHPSVTTDYCDECGDPIASRSDERCPLCTTPRNANDRYCEQDGYDFVERSAPASARSWQAIVTADHEYFDRVGPRELEFPDDAPQRTFALDGDEILIGRRSRSDQIAPDIDLAFPPEDPGISHRHATLVRDEDGTFTIVDLASTNGTTMNTDGTPLPPRTPVTVTDGDRIHLGAWTTITIRSSAPASPRA
jgi:hypothetical protein